MTQTIPLTIVYPGPSPHAVDFFSALHCHGGFDLEVLFCLPAFITRGGWPVPEMNFRHEHLPSRRLLRSSEFAVWNRGLVERVRRAARAGRMHLLSGGYTIPAVALSMQALNRLGAQWYFHSEKPGISSNPVKRVIRNAVIRSCLRGCTRILAYSPIAAEAYEALGFARSAIEFLPYYMDVSQFKEIRRSWRDVNSRPIRFLYFGQLHPIKGVDWLLRVMPGLRDIEGRFELTVAGDGPLRGELEAFARANGLRNVRFPGPVAWEERWKCFAEHDVLVLPSRHDGWGMVVMEALASGMPVIGSTHSGAVQAYVREGVNGMRVPYLNDAALQSAIRNCINSPDELGGLGSRCRESIADWEPAIGAEKLHALISSDRNGRRT